MYRVLLRGVLLIATLGLLVVWLDSEHFFDRRGGGGVEKAQENVEETQPRRSLGAYIIQGDSEGHFYVDAWVNDDPVSFMVDTGASMVVLTRDTANYLGFDLWDEEFDIDVRTASGTVKGARITLDEININDEVIAYNVSAVVLMEGDMDLLGMSFLRKIDRFTVEGNALYLFP